MLDISLSIILFIIGYLIIYFAADVFLDNLKEVCILYGISPFVIGALLIGIDPEESIASIIAAINGLSYLAIGNVIGNSIFALTISFAIPAFFYKVDFKKIPQFYFVLLYISLILILLGIIVNFGMLFIGIIAIIIYFVYLIRNIKQFSKGSSIRFSSIENLMKSNNDNQELKAQSKSKKIILIITSFISIFLGGELLIFTAEQIIIRTNIPETFFGLIIIAFITNVEELTLVIKSIKKKSIEIGLGGMIGKVIWNLTLTFGISAIFITNFQFLWILFWNWFLLAIIIIYFIFMSKKQSLVLKDGIVLILFLILFLSINFTIVI